MIALTATFPRASAQTPPTTTISDLNYPSNTVEGKTLVVSFDLNYSMGPYAYLWLMSAVACGPSELNCSFVSADGVSSSPFPCNPTNPFGNSQLFIPESCYLTVSTETGSFERFSYQFSFNQSGNYSLTAMTQLNQIGHRYDENGSLDLRHMVIAVNSRPVPEFSGPTPTIFLVLVAALYVIQRKRKVASA